MASVLYREGKGHVEQGVECEMIRVEPDQYDAMINAGWSPTPPGVEAPQPVPVSNPEDQVSFDDPKDPGHLADGSHEPGAITDSVISAEQIEESYLKGYEEGYKEGMESRDGEVRHLEDKATNLQAEIDSQKVVIERLNADLGQARSGDAVGDAEGQQNDFSDNEETAGAQNADGSVDAISEMSVEEVRQSAKDAGLDGWDSKRVKTLRQELKALESK